MHQIIHLNRDWIYADNFHEDYLSQEISNGISVDLPHTNIILPFNYFDEKAFCFISTYQKKYYFGDEFNDKRIILTFEGVMAYAEVYINGRIAKSHKGGYLPFSVDIRPFINLNKENLITVIVNSNELDDIPPFGGVIDYLTYGGIYREVHLTIIDNESLNDVKIITSGTTKISFDIQATLNKDKNYTIVVSILNPSKEVIKKETYKNINQNSLKFVMSNIVASEWNLETPTLYTLSLELYDGMELIDEISQRFGFREVEFRKDGFYLNKKKIKLIGLNHHQSYPYVGYAMPKRAHYNDVKMLKYDLGVNIVRMSHYSHSKHFLDACDEMGLLVFSEIPGWQHVSSKPSWREVVKQNVEEMINRDFNHPSIIIWGVRINESKDDDELYEETNNIARKLDPTRPTGGVRNFEFSSFKEDVYTYNDFSHDGGSLILKNPNDVAPKNAPYLVTEHNGHMFPTKSFDNEERRAEHALRHLRVINTMMGNDRISGAIGWCMNDYNTHQEFGSGDRICYHGVNDMFRNPKYAFYSYASQSDHKVVLQPLTTHNNGDYDASFSKGTYILTNCDYVDFLKNDVFIGRFYPDRKSFPHLKHPPILIDDFIGESINKEEHRFSKNDLNNIKNLLNELLKYGGPNNLPLFSKLKAYALIKKNKLSYKDVEELYGKYVANWNEKDPIYEYIGYIKGKEVKRVTIGKSVFSDVIVEADDYELEEAETYDVTRIVVKYVDQFGNPLHYSFEPILITIDGPLALIGPASISLMGGVAAFYVRTMNKTGEAIINVGNDRFVKEIKINVSIKDEEVNQEQPKKTLSRFTTIFRSKELTQTKE